MSGRTKPPPPPEPVPPPELVLQLVMPFLSLFDHLACTLVSKRWKAYADAEIVRHEMRFVVDHRLQNGNVYVRKPRMVTERLQNTRWSCAEWVDLKYVHRFRFIGIEDVLVDVDLPRLRRLVIRDLRMRPNAAPPMRLLAGPDLRHLQLLLETDQHNYATTMYNTYAMLQAVGDRLVTLRLSAPGGVRDEGRLYTQYFVRHRKPMISVKHLPDNRHVERAIYRFDALDMPRLEHLELGAQFAWLSLHAPRVTCAVISESPECLSQVDMRPTIVAALASAEGTLRDLTWIVRRPMPRDVAGQMARCIARFTGLERLHLDGAYSIIASCGTNHDVSALIPLVPATLRTLHVECHCPDAIRALPSLSVQTDLDTLTVSTRCVRGNYDERVHDEVLRIADGRARTIRIQWDGITYMYRDGARVDSGVPIPTNNQYQPTIPSDRTPRRD